MVWPDGTLPKGGKSNSTASRPIRCSVLAKFDPNIYLEGGKSKSMFDAKGPRVNPITFPDVCRYSYSRRSVEIAVIYTHSTLCVWKWGKSNSMSAATGSRVSLISRLLLTHIDGVADLLKQRPFVRKEGKSNSIDVV